jgi:hypothetical protein
MLRGRTGYSLYMGTHSSSFTGNAKPRGITPMKVALDGSMKLTLISRVVLGKEKPRSMTPFTTLNMAVTLPMPRASAVTASAQKALSCEHAQDNAEIPANAVGEHRQHMAMVVPLHCPGR